MDEQMTIVTRKGQITVPVEIRRALNLQIGDRVAISIEDGEPPVARLRPVRSVSEATHGVFRGSNRSLSPEFLEKLGREEIADNAAQEGVDEV